MKRLNPDTLFKPQAYTQADVTKMTTFVVGYKPELRPIVGEARTEFLGGSPPPGSTLVGVTALADPAYLVEIEAIAVTE